ncbi:MAG: hypothetical protein ABIW84_09435 [Ilumatobacteraceae bacterium]
MRVLALATAAALAVLTAGCGSDDESAQISAPASTAAAPTPSTTSVTSITPTTALATATTTATSATPVTTEPAAAPGTTSDVDTSAAPVTSVAPPPAGSDDTVFQQGNIEPALESSIEIAVADLAERLGIDAATIETSSAVFVEWPDSSLGCPTAGMQYLQVLTEGTLIELSVDSTIYRYHSGGLAEPFLCDQPLNATPPTLG